MHTYAFVVEVTLRHALSEACLWEGYIKHIYVVRCLGDWLDPRPPLEWMYEGNWGLEVVTKAQFATTSHVGTESPGHRHHKQSPSHTRHVVLSQWRARGQSLSLSRRMFKPATITHAQWRLAPWIWSICLEITPSDCHSNYFWCFTTAVPFQIFPL